VPLGWAKVASGEKMQLAEPKGCIVITARKRTMEVPGQFTPARSHTAGNRSELAYDAGEEHLSARELEALGLRTPRTRPPGSK
jgi:hypothetical protein